MHMLSDGVDNSEELMDVLIEVQGKIIKSRPILLH